MNKNEIKEILFEETNGRCAYCDDMYPRYRVGKFGVITEFTDLNVTFYAEKIGLLK